MVAAEKIAGLRKVLAADGRVVFRDTGAIVTWDAEVDLVIDFPDGSRRRVNEFAHDQFAQAYAIAATPPEPPPPPVAKIKPTRSRTDFGDCPF